MTLRQSTLDERAREIGFIKGSLLPIISNFILGSLSMSSLIRNTNMLII
jgi:hypothetical protein